MNEPLPDPVFRYEGGELRVEDVKLSDIAHAVDTPVYCYSAGALRRRYAEFAAALEGLDAEICYALKANSNQAVIRLFADMGAGADVVSEGEIRRALAAGVPAERIVFSGVGKTEAEIAFALDRGIMQINVESEAELELLSAVATAHGRTAHIAVRVNPDVDAATHAKISTGRKENKFGIDLSRAPAIYARAAALPGVEPVGLAVHIGSQITSLDPPREAFGRVAELVRVLRLQGHGVERLDLGGGLGIRYRDESPPDVADYGRMVRETVGDLGCTLVFEPGRWLVGNAGVLLARVIYVKEGEHRRFLVLDAAMNDLKRPAMYDAYHPMLRVREPAAGEAPVEYDVVGPVCESTDIFTAGRPLPPSRSGDLIAIGSAGAYGAVMASTYNTRLLAPEVLVEGERFAVVRRRPHYDELIGLDAIPDWLEPPRADVRRRGAA